MAHTRHHFVRIALLAALIGTPALAHAQEGDPIAQRVNELSNKGFAAYQKEDYATAIEYFEKAYALEEVPNLLYNIARCYEKMEQWDKAIAYYEQFIVAPEVESEGRQKALKRVENIREIIATTKDLDNQKSATTSGGTHGEGGVQAPTTPADPKKSPWPYVTLGTGAALLGGGVIFGLLANADATTFEEADALSERQVARDGGQRRALIADGLYITGGIVTAVGLFLVLRGPGEDTPAAEGAASEESSVSVQPAFGRDGGGVTLRVRF